MTTTAASTPHHLVNVVPILAAPAATTPPTRRVASGRSARLAGALGLLALALGPAPSPAADGDLDPTFRSGGKLVYLTPVAGVAGIAIDADGRLLVPFTKILAGTDRDLALLRVPDSGAIVQCSYGLDLGGTDADYAYGLAVNGWPAQDGQRVYLAGAGAGPANDPSWRATVGAINEATCTLDTDFSGDGHEDIGELPGPPDPGQTAPAVLWVPDHQGVVKLLELPNGGYGCDGSIVSIDDQFGGNDFNWSTGSLGWTQTDDCLWLDPKTLLRQPDGKILVVGSVGWTSGDWDVYVQRFSSSGERDLSFSVDSIATFSYDIIDTGQDHGLAAALLPDGRIVIGGQAERAQGTAAAVAVLKPNGQFDNGFGIFGRYTFDFANPNALNIVAGVGVQPDGKIVAGGSAGPVAPYANTDFAVARLLPSGANPLDPSFSGDGIVKIPFDIAGGTKVDRATSLRIDGAGRIVVGGFALDSGNNIVPVAARLQVAYPLISDGFESGGTTTWSKKGP